MAELIRTLILCGFLSGTQPITLMGLLLVLGGATRGRTVWPSSAARSSCKPGC